MRVSENLAVKETAPRMPLVVDLDGTLVSTDTIWELLVAFLKNHPLGVFRLVFWVLSGKAHFKQKLASHVGLDAEVLPYRSEFLAWLREQKEEGRSVLLATGTDARSAAAVASHLDLFDGVISSDGKVNATGQRKSSLIAAALPKQAFEYAGNALVDIPVWKDAKSVVVVAPHPGVLSALKRQGIPVDKLFPAPKASFRVWAKALRVHQWVKNVLIFTPLLTSHRLFDTLGMAHAALGFLIFSLVASSTYLINDLMDLPADRRHATKRRRPLAAGLISIPSAILVAVTLLIVAAALSALLPKEAAVLVFGYSVATVYYSAFLKRLLMLDVVSLALFYTARLMYGGLVTGIEISIWTLAFCAFSFFSLAGAKRINDLAKASLRSTEVLRHRAYQAQDANALVSLASATSMVAVLVLILYINSEQGEKLYHHPRALWAMCVPLLYWFSRILMLANRGKLADDPILFAAKDRATYIVVGMMGLIALLAS